MCVCVCVSRIEMETAGARRLKLCMKVGFGPGQVLTERVGGSEVVGGRWRLF